MTRPVECKTRWPGDPNQVAADQRFSANGISVFPQNLKRLIPVLLYLQTCHFLLTEGVCCMYQNSVICIIVIFLNNSTYSIFAVASRVLGQTKHVYDGHTLQLKMYQDRLGNIPDGHDTSQPCIQIPKDLIMQNLNPNVVRYLQSIPDSRKQLENDILRQLKGKVNWAHQVETELRISCTIKKEDKDARSRIKDWQDVVRQSVNFFISKVEIEKRECLKKIWPEVCAEVGKVRKANKTIAVIERDEEHTLYVVGQPKTVKKIYQQIDQMCSEMEEKLEHMRDPINISSLEKALIEKVDLITNMVQHRPKLKISLQQDELVFEGPPRDLLDSQKELNNFLRNVQKNELKLSKGQLKVLKMLRRQPENPIDAAMSQYKAVIHSEEQNIVLAGMPVDVNKCQDIIAAHIKEAMIPVAEDEKNACHGQSWDKFANEIFMKCKGTLHLEVAENHSTIEVVAYSGDFEGVLEDIRNFIKKNAIKKERLTMSRAHTRMIAQWMVGDLKQIEENFKSYSIQIESLFEGFQIKGTQDGLRPASARIKQLTEKILGGTHTVTTPGMPYYFTQVESGKAFLRAREERYHVIIHYQSPDETEGIERSIIPSSPDTGRMVELEQATHEASGVAIKVLVGDMTQHKVDAIVNAANSELQHIGGLAKAIADKSKVHWHFGVISVEPQPNSLYCVFIPCLRWFTMRFSFT